MILYLLDEGTDAKALAHLLDKESGLLGISGSASDMRQLREFAAKGNHEAKLATQMFARTAAKAIGGFAAVMGKVDTLVFTGGIGEHDANIRAQICAGMEPFGLRIDELENEANSLKISRSASSTSVEVIESDEDGQIARHVAHLLHSEN